MKADKSIFLIRHGHIETGGEKKYIGHTNLSLSEKGRKQSENLHRVFSSLPFGLLISSDLNRSRETAEIIGKDHPFKREERSDFREIFMGEWENLSHRKVKSDFPQEHAEREKNLYIHRPPGGESFSDLQRRILPVFNEILGSSQNSLLIVGHASVNRVILCNLLGMPLENIFRIGQDYGCVNHIIISGDGIRITALNRLFVSGESIFNN